VGIEVAEVVVVGSASGVLVIVLALVALEMVVVVPIMMESSAQPSFSHLRLKSSLVRRVVKSAVVVCKFEAVGPVFAGTLVVSSHFYYKRTIIEILT